MGPFAHVIMWLGVHSSLGYFTSWVRLETWAAVYCENHHPEEWTDA